MYFFCGISSIYSEKVTFMVKDYEKFGELKKSWREEKWWDTTVCFTKNCPPENRRNFLNKCRSYLLVVLFYSTNSCSSHSVAIAPSLRLFVPRWLIFFFYNFWIEENGRHFIDSNRAIPCVHSCRGRRWIVAVTTFNEIGAWNDIMWSSSTYFMLYDTVIPGRNHNYWERNR